MIRPVLLLSLTFFSAVCSSKAILGDSIQQSMSRYGKPIRKATVRGKLDVWYFRPPYYVHQTYSDAGKAMVCTYAKAGLTESEFRTILRSNVGNWAYLERIDGNSFPGRQMWTDGRSIACFFAVDDSQDFTNSQEFSKASDRC